MRTSISISFVLGFLSACGSTPEPEAATLAAPADIDATALLTAACGRVELGAGLVRVPTADVPADAGHNGVLITSDGTSTYLGNRLLGEKPVEQLTALRADAPPQGAPRWAADTVVVIARDDVAGADVGALVDAAGAAGFKKAEIVVQSREPLPELQFADPAFGAELKARIEPMGVSEKQMTIFKEIDGAAGGCPALRDAFMKASAASTDKCQVFAAAIEEAIGQCEGVNKAALVTAIQTSMNPAGTGRGGRVVLDLPLSWTWVHGTWSDEVTALQAR